MIQKHYKLREDQVKFLEQLPGNASEHIRSAIDDYMLKKKRESLNVSLSPSVKGVNFNG